MTAYGSNEARDRAIAVASQLRARALARQRREADRAVPRALWVALHEHGLETAERLADAGQWDALGERIETLSLETLHILVAKLGDGGDPHRAMRFAHLASLQLAKLGGVEAALALALRDELLHPSATLVELAGALPPALRGPALEALDARTALDERSPSGLARDRCEFVALLPPGPARDAALDALTARVPSYLPREIDAGENPFVWLARAHARCGRLDECEVLLERASESVRDARFDTHSDAFGYLHIAAELAPERAELRARFARRAWALFGPEGFEYQPPVAPELIALDPTLAAELDAHAHARAATDPVGASFHEATEPWSAPDWSARAPLEERLAVLRAARDERAREGAARARAGERSELRSLLFPTPIPSEPAAREPREVATESPAAQETAARATLQRFLHEPLEQGPGWLRTVSGACLDYPQQHELAPHLSLDETHALLARAPADCEPGSLVYLIEHAARLHAARGELGPMRRLVASIANYSTTPHLEFQLACALPEALREGELRRLFTTLDAPDGVRGHDAGLYSTRRTCGLVTAAAWSPYWKLAVEAVSLLPPCTLRIECWGRFLHSEERTHEDRALLAARCASDVREALRERPRALPRTDDAVRAYESLDDALVRAVWNALCAAPGFERHAPPWSLAARVGGAEALETHLRALEEGSPGENTVDLRA